MGEINVDSVRQHETQATKRTTWVIWNEHIWERSGIVNKKHYNFKTIFDKDMTKTNLTDIVSLRLNASKHQMFVCGYDILRIASNELNKL